MEIYEGSNDAQPAISVLLRQAIHLAEESRGTIVVGCTSMNTYRQQPLMSLTEKHRCSQQEGIPCRKFAPAEANPRSTLDGQDVNF
jgi:hypothetical protein